MSKNDDSSKNSANTKEQLEEIQNKIALNKAAMDLVESEKALAAKIKGDIAAEDEKTRLEKEKQVVDAQTALNESKKTQAANLFPKGQSQGVEGTITTTSNFGYATEQIAYQLIERNAQKIADTIDKLSIVGPNNKQAKILIVKDISFAQGDFPLLFIRSLIENYKISISSQLKKNSSITEPDRAQLIPTDKEFLASAAAPVLMALPSIISGGLSFAADVLRFFKGDYDVKVKEFNIDEEAVISSIAGKIAEQANPGKHQKPTIQIYNFNIETESPLILQIQTLLQDKQSLEGTVAILKSEVASENNREEIKKMQTEIQELKKSLEETSNKKEKSEIDRKNAELQAKTKALKALSNKLEDANKSIIYSENLLKSFDTFFNSITSSTDVKPPLLLDAVLRQYIVTSEVTHLMHIKVCSKGGEAITIKKPMSVGGGDTSYISGIAISYVLAKRSGEIEAAGTLSDLASLNYKLGSKKDENGAAKIRYILTEKPQDGSKPERKWWQP